MAELEGYGSALEPPLHAAARGRVTLDYSSQDTEHNNAVVVRDYLKVALHYPERARILMQHPDPNGIVCLTAGLRPGRPPATPRRSRPGREHRENLSGAASGVDDRVGIMRA